MARCSMTTASTAGVVHLLDSVEPVDELGAQHKARALRWLSETSDIYRRVKPRTPSPHLVSYFLVVDRQSRRVLLCDHRLSGLWLPTGGHVEPGEHPVDTVRREVVEELGIEAQFDPVHGAKPFFLTVTDTVGAPEVRHTDVSLWFALSGARDLPLTPDQREFVEVRWWSQGELRSAESSRFEPHLIRALDVLEP
jgi:8-oxo-dGTP diphosphatase